MSIASEISRLQGAKADIKTAIEGKGVTVPSATKLDGYADLVDAIPQGSTPTGTKQISVTQNGTQTENVSGYASAQLNVAVPNSYSASDEGKVVSNGALVAQTAHADVTPTTSDQTIDTTTNNSIKVKGDANLVAGNIKKDVEIFGTTGSYEGGGGDTTIEDALVSGTLSGAYENDRVTKAKIAAFRGCTSLTSLKLPNITSVPPQCCYGCTSLTVFSAVNATSGGGDLINGCTSLLTVALPKLNDVENNALNKSNSVQTIDVLGGIIRGAMGNDSSLTTLIIRKTSVSNLVVTSAFNGTPFASGGSGGTIYIPKALYDHLGDGTSSDYKAQTNWATIDGYGTITWAAIEGSYYETHYADGTPIPT